MKIYRSAEGFKKLTNPVVTSGTFDGVHIGHQKILERVREVARQTGGETVLITFWPHPRLILNPDDDSLKLLSTFEEKSALLEKFGIDHLIQIPFTKEFSQTTSEEFIRHILIDTIGTKRLVIGYDHRFGRNREGSFEHLQANSDRYGFKVEEISRQDIDDSAVSSTKTRKALTSGDVATATGFLGRPYTLTGEVVHGDKIGRQLGYPTANIRPHYSYKLIPAHGIYAVEVDVQGTRYGGMLNIGTRPTFNGKRETIEVYLFDFDRVIYGEELTLHFIHRVRDEVAFGSKEALIEAMKNDEVESRKVLGLSK
ncbi:bifunctional riboflavin kinase/FAD synthetase [Roseivirga sp. BDSF3-8]|uniref:bifunctional riboflavin kinase/FAD synthetase n=1 Tax=Roseivirga sp. BDSF3-8 TaxID=3241598 RepID=UPI003531BE7C